MPKTFREFPYEAYNLTAFEDKDGGQIFCLIPAQGVVN
jgi:hypothetical protein